MADGWKSRLREYTISLLAWTALGLFLFSQGLAQKVISRDPTPWWHYLVSWMTGSYCLAILTPGVLWLGRRFPFERRNWRRRIALHLVFSLIFPIIQLAFEGGLLSRFGVFPSVMKGFAATFVFLLVVGYHQNVLTYWLILGAQHALKYYRQYRERERQASRLELHASELKAQLVRAHLSTLKMQLQPHFLFNTLNAIMVLVRQQRTRHAEEMLGRLSDLLRCVLDDVETQEVPLRRELEYLELYLSIEQVRFQDRLKVEISADPTVLQAAFPHMALQPIVENAIRHGIGRRSAAGRIRIGASRKDGMLQVMVQDDGPGLPTANYTSTPGIGVPNTRARLTQLYGDAGQLAIENAAEGGCVVTMVLPFHLAPETSEKEMMHAFDNLDR